MPPKAKSIAVPDAEASEPVATPVVGRKLASAKFGELEKGTGTRKSNLAKWNELVTYTTQQPTPSYKNSNIDRLHALLQVHPWLCETEAALPVPENVPLTPVVEYKADNHQKRKLKKEAVQKDEAKRAKKKTYLEQKLDEYLEETNSFNIPVEDIYPMVACASERLEDLRKSGGNLDEALLHRDFTRKAMALDIKEIFGTQKEENSPEEEETSPAFPQIEDDEDPSDRAKSDAALKNMLPAERKLAAS